MITFGLGIGGLLIVAGIATYYLAPRVGPNPIFGVRVGYSYASREVWDRTNRAGGMLIAAIGLGTAAAGMALAALNVPVTTGIAWLTGAMIVALLAGTAWMFLFARNLALGTDAAREVRPVSFRWLFVLPVLLTFFVLLALAFYSYPLLPAERLATHFDLANEPNGWSSREAFVLGMVGLSALFVVINLALLALARREPIVAFGRWGSHWRLEPQRGLLYESFALALVNLILILVFQDVVQFNIQGAHLFPLNWLLAIIILFIGALIALFFVLAKRGDVQS